MRFPDDLQLKQLLQLGATIPAPGTWFGDYELVRELGRGGMGVVYEARQPSFKTTVALKLLLDGELASEALERQFLFEAEEAFRLSHPNIVKVCHFGKSEGRPFFTMELIKGDSLAHELAQRPHPPTVHESWRRDVGMMIRVVRAVHYAHTCGLLHRDLKPANILLDEKGPHLTDFGLALRWRQDDDASPPCAAGTLPYMAPEQLSGAAPLTVATDIYGLGAILYELVSGKRPFDVTSSAELRQRMDEELPVRLQRLNPAVPAELERVCHKCLESDPDARYASAEQLAEDLEAVLRGRPSSLIPRARWRRPIHWMRRHPRTTTRAMLTMLGAVLLVASFASVWLAATRESQRVLSTNAAIASGQAGAALFQLREYADRVQTCATDRELVAQTEAGAPSARALSALRAIADGFDSVFVLNTDGKTLMQVPRPSGIERSFQFRDYFQGARWRGERGQRQVYVARAIRSEMDGALKFGVSAPIFSGGRWIGVLVAIVAADSVFGKVRMRDDSETGRVTALLGPRDIERSQIESHARPRRFVVLVHDGLGHGEEVPAADVPGALRAEPPVGQQFSLTYARPLQDSAYRDPVRGFEGRWLAAFAPVGGTGYVIAVQTRWDGLLHRLGALPPGILLVSVMMGAVGTLLMLLALRPRLSSHRDGVDPCTGDAPA